MQTRSSALDYRPPLGLPRVLHEDAQVLVVDKPPGLLSVPGRLPEHHDSALLRLQAIFGQLWVVHRLDMDTSGLIAYARTREAAAHLGRQFEQRTVQKRYEALVWGRPPSPRGVIALPLRIDWPHRPRQVVDGLAGKPSVTHYECVSIAVTGRSHQLRVHLSAIGLPIVGDRFYGSVLDNGLAGGERLMLHARTLVLRHPTDGQVLRLDAPPGF
jgi:tRNA pseudouridine32 synthase/23S rRNA pseudouridine746 synthase